MSGEDEENFLKSFKDFAGVFSRLMGMVAGFIILAVTGVILLLAPFFLDLSLFKSPWIFVPGVFLNLTGIYWILTGFRPEYKLGEMLSQRFSLSKDQVEGAGIMVFTFCLWGLLMFTSDSWTDRILFSFIAVPGLLIGYMNIHEI